MQTEQISSSQPSQQTAQQQPQASLRHGGQPHVADSEGASNIGEGVIKSTEADKAVPDAAGTTVRQVSELEEGEILEDEPVATVPKHEPGEVTNVLNGGHSSSSWNAALPGSANRRDSGTGFLSSGFGAVGKPVFGSVWQPGSGFKPVP